nr:Band 3 anion transport protein - mouse (fragments) [Mus musculus]
DLTIPVTEMQDPEALYLPSPAKPDPNLYNTLGGPGDEDDPLRRTGKPKPQGPVPNTAL